MKVSFINNIFLTQFHIKKDKRELNGNPAQNTDFNDKGNHSGVLHYNNYKYIPNIIFRGRRPKNAIQKETAIISDDKAQEFLDAFPTRNKSIEHVIKAFETNPNLSNTDIESLKENTSQVVEHFKQNGKLSYWAYNRACYNRPALFTFPANEVIANVENVYEKFKTDGMKLDEYIDVCTYYPKLFVTPFNETIERINNLHSTNAKKYSKKECIALCMENPELIFSNFDNINKSAAAIDFIKRANKADRATFKIPDAINYVGSQELIYLIFASPAEFAGCTSKRDVDEQVEKFIFYHKTHPTSNLALKVPDIDGVDEYKRILRDFLNPQIGRDAFAIPKKSKSLYDDFSFSDSAFLKTLSDTDEFLDSLIKTSEKLSKTDDSDTVVDETKSATIKENENVSFDDEETTAENDDAINSAEITQEALKLRTQGMTYKNIGKKINISQTAAINRIKVHNARKLHSTNNLPPEYYIKAKLLLDTFNISHSIEDIVQTIINNPSLLNADVKKFINNIDGVVREFEQYGLKKEDYIEACFTEPVLFHQISSSVIKRVTELCNKFEADGLTKDKYIKACLVCPELFTRSADTIATNINGVVNEFAGAGLTKKEYIKSCLTSPSLLNEKSERIVANIYDILEHFKDNGLLTEDLIKACCNNYRIYQQNPKTIISNVETVYEYYKDRGLTLNEYIRKCTIQSNLFTGNPQTLIGKINAYMYAAGTNKVTTTFASYSLEYIYMSKIVLKQFLETHDGIINNHGKRPYNAEVKQQFIDYYKNHKDETLTLKIPLGECSAECIKTLNKFSAENIGRNIFNYEFVNNYHQ